MQAILVISSSNNINQYKEFCNQFINSDLYNVYIYNDTLTFFDRQEIVRDNIKILRHKDIVDNNIEFTLLKVALDNKDNRYFHLMDEYSFIFPNTPHFYTVFNTVNTEFVDFNNPKQWSITRNCAEYLLSEFINNKTDYIINILNTEIYKSNEDIQFNIYNDNLRFNSVDSLNCLNISEYVNQGILNKCVLDNLDVNKIGFSQLLKQLKYIYSLFNK